VSGARPDDSARALALHYLQAPRTASDIKPWTMKYSPPPRCRTTLDKQGARSSFIPNPADWLCRQRGPILQHQFLYKSEGVRQELTHENDSTHGQCPGPDERADQRPDRRFPKSFRLFRGALFQLTCFIFPSGRSQKLSQMQAGNNNNAVRSRISLVFASTVGRASTSKCISTQLPRRKKWP
jgi:hypothetical protein